MEIEWSVTCIANDWRIWRISCRDREEVVEVGGWKQFERKNHSTERERDKKQEN